MEKEDPSKLGLKIKNTVTIMQKAFDFELRRSVGIPWTHAKVMGILLNKDGISQKEIAESILIEAPTLVPIIDRMERDGLVERRQDSSDRRNNRVYLTSRARSLQTAIDACMNRTRAMAYKGISKSDLETTMSVLDIITRNASDYLDQESPQPGVEKRNI